MLALSELLCSHSLRIAEGISKEEILKDFKLWRTSERNDCTQGVNPSIGYGRLLCFAN